MRDTPRFAVRLGFRMLVTLIALGAPGVGSAGTGGTSSASDPGSRGRALFLRSWKPDDRRGHGGDGLGPVFNERSCVACHNLNGPGGAGSASKNVDVVGIFFDPPGGPNPNCPSPTTGTSPSASPPRPDPNEMAAIHPGFADGRSIVLHRFGLAPSYENWRRHFLRNDSPQLRSGTSANRNRDPDDEPPLDRPAPLPREVQRGSYRLQRSQRNSTALFGDGLIDTIPDAVIAAGADAPGRHHSIRGRASRLPDGRIGRFGWKGQIASLEEFVLTACSVEVGLEVPGHRQASDPMGYGQRLRGLDMTRSECDDLIAYVRGLPAPLERAPSNALGKELFTRLGCADCHVPRLGDVAGIYSDLLLHDMGNELDGTGGYGSAPPPPAEIVAPGGPSPNPPASGREWRTPPLWGVRSSAPYMHDGRAATLEQAIALHQGEAADVTRFYHALGSTRQRQLLQFLESLGAPRPQPQVAHRGRS